MGVPPGVQLREEDIGRLQIAVYYAFFMCVMDRCAEGFDESRRTGRGQRQTFEQLVKAASLNQFERQKRPALVLADLVDLDNVGMLQSGGRFGFGESGGVRQARRRLPSGPSSRRPCD